MNWLIGIGIVALAALMIWATIDENNRCAANRGHMVTKSISGVGFGSDGKVVPTFSTISFCLSKDGRIIEQ